MLVRELKGLDDSDGLLDGPTDGQVMYMSGAQDALGVDEEGAAERDALFLEQDAVRFGDGVVLVRELCDIRDMLVGKRRINTPGSDSVRARARPRFEAC